MKLGAFANVGSGGANGEGEGEGAVVRADTVAEHEIVNGEGIGVEMGIGEGAEEGVVEEGGAGLERAEMEEKTRRGRGEVSGVGEDEGGGGAEIVLEEAARKGLCVRLLELPQAAGARDEVEQDVRIGIAQVHMILIGL